MIAILVTVATACASALVLRLDRDRVRLSPAIWIPFIWLAIASSRPVSNWMTFSAPADVSSQYIDGSPLDRNVLMLLLLLALVPLAKRSRSFVRIVNANAPLVIFLTYCAVSMLWADYPFVALKRWIRSAADVVMVCIILTEAHPAEAFRRAVMRLGWMLIPLSIIFTRFFPSLGRSYTYGGAPMWTGVATDKNALGALCMIVGVLFLSHGLNIYRSRGNHRQRRLAVTTMLLAMVLYLLLMIDSKTALASFVMASLLVSLCASPLFRRPWILTCAVVSMLATSYSVLFLGIGSSALAEMGRDASLTGRTEVWEVVLPFAVNPWIGAGFENFWIGDRLTAIVRALGAGLNQAHNGYIEIYLNLGWVGLVLLLLVILNGYGNIMRGLRANPEMAGLKLAYFFICLVYNFTEAAFKIMSPVWIMFLWATMSVPQTRISMNLQARRRLRQHSLSESETTARGDVHPMYAG